MGRRQVCPPADPEGVRPRNIPEQEPHFRPQLQHGHAALVRAGRGRRDRRRGVGTVGALRQAENSPRRDDQYPGRRPDQPERPDDRRGAEADRFEAERRDGRRQRQGVAGPDPQYQGQYRGRGDGAGHLYAAFAGYRFQCDLLGRGGQQDRFAACDQGVPRRQGGRHARRVRLPDQRQVRYEHPHRGQRHDYRPALRQLRGCDRQGETSADLRNEKRRDAGQGVRVCGRIHGRCL